MSWGAVALALVVAALFLSSGSSAYGHTLPVSRVEMRADSAGMDVAIDAPAIDLSHDLADVTPDMLLDPRRAGDSDDALFAVIASRFRVEADGRSLTPTPLDVQPRVAQRELRMRIRFSWPAPPAKLRVTCRLFPYDARHVTMASAYWDGMLDREWVFDEATSELEYAVASSQRVDVVVRQFFSEGVRHIFLGIDHIFFIVGLLLLGGKLRTLFKIVTAFTAAHSVTLILATLQLLSPPARLIEPAIALSIVCVGVHDLRVRKGSPDRRLLFAFAFGLIHGFGFAEVLREMSLPRAALGWSLLAFNLGVEAGQASIVIAIEPLLRRLRRSTSTVGRALMSASAWGVIVAGVVWFVQRILPAQ